ncbi:MAG: tyrosine--tRNA ligase [Patescibacteria group bacterium]
MKKQTRPSRPSNELLTRGVGELIGSPDLKQRLRKGDRLKIYLGVDPSGPVIHLGHAVILWKLRALQDLGHRIIFLIGDFTGRIGDPTDRTAIRQPLTSEQVLKNAKSYKKQIEKIIRFSGSNPAVLRFNSEWHDRLIFREVVGLAQQFTVQQFLEREMFEKRLREGRAISLSEFLYPLMQGYDAVMLDADVQVGGTDQLFNMLAGRTLLRAMKKKEMMVMTFELLPGTDGRKMSKSFQNDIGVMDAPEEMYGKVMSLHDDLILSYFKLCTNLSSAQIHSIAQSLKEGMNPRDLKARLAREIVAMYHAPQAARAAEDAFDRLFRKHEIPQNLQEVVVEKKRLPLRELLVETGLLPSRSEARRMMEQGAVRVDGSVRRDIQEELDVQAGMVVQVGKRKFIKLV